MTNTKFTTRVRELAALCQDLTHGVCRLPHVSDSDELLDERLRRALAHVDLALEALEFRPSSADAAADRRLLQRFMRMVDRLAGGGTKEGSTAEARPQPPASSRSGWRALQNPGAGILSASTATISIPDFLGFLQVQGKTGLLQVTLPNERITLLIANGVLVDARSDNSPAGSRLGEILVEQRAIDQKTLENFFVYHTRSQGRLGRALGLKELITEQQLRDALSEQVVRMVRRMLEAANAPYTFQEGGIDSSESDLRLGVIELLLESMRRTDEARSAALEAPTPALPSAPAGGEGAEAEPAEKQRDQVP